MREKAHGHQILGLSLKIYLTFAICLNVANKQRVLMQGHQGWNVRHGLCHIYMIYVYIWIVYSFCLFCCLFIIVTTQFVALYKPCKPKGGGWGCEVSFGGHLQPRGKTTTWSALDGAVFDIAQILAYLVHNMSRSQLYLGFGHFGWLPFFSVNNILAGLWLNCISSVKITLFLLADILLQHRALFQC